MAKQKNTPGKIDQYDLVLFNFQGIEHNISKIIYEFSIYEDLFKNFNTCTVLIQDALGFTERMPIVGDENIVITYKTPGDRFKLRTRQFKLYKTSKRIEGAQRQVNFIAHGIEEFAIRQEMQSVDKSFVGQTVTKAIEDIYYDSVNAGSNADKGFSGSLSAGTTGGLGNLGGTSSFMSAGAGVKQGKKYSSGRAQQNVLPLLGKGTDKIVQSNNKTTYVAPGVTPMEAIHHLRKECIHKSGRNNSDYIFFQNADGFHYTTLGELKEFGDQDGDNKKQFLLGDQALARGDGQEEFPAENIILKMSVRKTIDTISNLSTGLYRNRVAVVDPLTKRYDSKTFIYNNEFGELELLNPRGNRIHAKNSQFTAPDSSTKTNYLVGELTTNSINQEVGSKFTPRSDYKDTPYIKDAVDIDRDPKIKFPNERHTVLNRRMAERAVLDAIVLDIAIPGNSDIKVGDIIYIFAPQPTGTTTGATSKLFNLFYGVKEARFLVTAVEQKYVHSKENYITNIEVMKDSFELQPEKIRQIVESEFV